MFTTFIFRFYTHSSKYSVQGILHLGISVWLDTLW